MKHLGVLALAGLVMSIPVCTAAPYCSVTAIDARAGMVTAKELTPGRIFSFKVTDGTVLPSVHLGQQIFVDFWAAEVPLDGKSISGRISGVASPLLAWHFLAEPAFSTVSSKQVDPCAIANADTLQALLQNGIQQLFPIPMRSGGEYFEISSPSIEQVSCPHMSIKVHADLKYRQTLGRLQFQGGGSMVLASSIIGDLQFSNVGNATTVTAANLGQAIAVVTDPQITSLMIDNVPSWLESSWIRECLNGQHTDWGCRDVIQQMKFNVTQLVQFYLQQGLTL